METQHRDYLRNLIMSLRPVFKQDEDMARGRYDGFGKKNYAPKPCAPHNYQLQLHGVWMCECGQILPKKKQPF